MPVDPEIAAVLKQIEEAGGPPVSEMTPKMAREAFAPLVALQGQPEDIAKVENRDVMGPAGPIPIRIYYPASAPAPSPVVFFIHGGGWVIMDLDSHDPICRALANGAGCVVVAAHYRLAPEARFPAAPDDCYAVLRWIADSADSLGCDAARIAVAGDSAGGNLSAAMTLLAAERGGPTLAAQVLHCPVTNHDFTPASYRENAEGYLLTTELMQWFWNHYLRDAADADHPSASPLRAPELSGLPPALVQTAEFDPLRDEGKAYAERLGASGVKVRYDEIQGVVHDPYLMIGVSPKGRRALDDAAAFLRQHLGR